MRIGVTYDLRSDYLALGLGEEETAEFDAEETIAAVCQALAELGHQPERIGGIKPLTQALAKGARWDAVFNICEGLRGVSREAQVPALLEAYDIPYVFSDPLTLALTLDKAMTKRVVRDAGVPTADFAVIESDADIAKVMLPFPLFLKPVAEGSGKGVDARSLVPDRGQLESVARDLLARFRQPVLVEEFLPGREFTVGITGTGAGASVLGVTEIVPKDKYVGQAYGYENKSDWEDKLSIVPVTDADADAAGAVALAAWKVLRCRDGGRADVRLDKTGKPRFIEVNPLAGIRPGYSDLCFIADFQKLSYRDLIGKFLDSFLARHPGIKKMKILVLHSDIAADAPPEELDTLIAADAVAKALEARGHRVEQAPFRQAQLQNILAGAAPEIVFNLVEGVDGQGRLAPIAPRMLAARHMRFTGASADAMALTNDKPLTKQKLRDAGLATPDWTVPPEWRDLTAGRWIVKAALEDASLGLDDQCVVEEIHVKARAEHCAARFGGGWFAERYVEGREFNIALLDGRVLPMAEMRFEHWPDGKPRIVGYDAKWEEDSTGWNGTVRAFGVEEDEPGLAEKLRAACEKVWRIFALTGFARVDFRVAEDGTPLILEINTNPCISPDAGFAAAAEEAGLSYEALIEAIVEAA